MANVTITQLPSATSITPGQDVLPIVSGGITTKATPDQIVTPALVAGLESPPPIGSATPNTGSFSTLEVGDTQKINWGTGNLNYISGSSGGIGVEIGTNGITQFVQTDPAAGGPKVIALMDQYGSLGLGTNIANPFGVVGLTVLGIDSTIGSVIDLRFNGTTQGQIAVDGNLMALLGASALSLGTAGLQTLTINTDQSIGIAGPTNVGTAGAMFMSQGAGAAPYWGNNPTINGGAINNATIGATTPSTGAFTTLSTTTSAVFQKSSLFKNLTGGDLVSFSGAGGATQPVLKVTANDAGQQITFNINSVDGTTGASLKINGISGQPSWTLDSYGNIFPTQGTTTQTNGFLYIPSGSGAPTGVPAVENAGVTCLFYDETNDYLYAYNAGWKKIGPFA